MLKWFRSKNDLKNEEPVYSENEWDDFFGFLVNEITDPAKSQDLVLVGKQSSRKPPQERFHSYLLFERYLTNLNLDKQYEKYELREVIYSKFHFLRKDPAFMILFLPEKDARVFVTNHFLEFCLNHTSETFDNARQSFIPEQLEMLSSCDLGKAESEIFNDFSIIANNLFDWISDKYGIGLAASIFHHSYEMSAFLYKEHEAFASIIAVLPKPIITEKQLHLLTQNQVEILFLEKLQVTERLNDALHVEIKERADAEKKLRMQEAMLRNIISSALDAIVTIDENGKLIAWNPSAETIFGYTAEEAYGKQLTDLIIPPSLREGHKKGFARFMATKEATIVNKGRLELPAIRKDGKEIFVELTITSVIIEGKYFFNGFLRDITKRKQED